MCFKLDAFSNSLTFLLFSGDNFNPGSLCQRLLFNVFHFDSNLEGFFYNLQNIAEIIARNTNLESCLLYLLPPVPS